MILLSRVWWADTLSLDEESRAGKNAAGIFRAAHADQNSIAVSTNRSSSTSLLE